MVEPVTLIAEPDLVEAAGTDAIQRRLAVAEKGFWAGIATTEPNVASGWHHHTDNHTIVFVVEGRIRVEWGTADGEAVEAGPGDFLHVPPQTVHREVNPQSVRGRAVVIRVGDGEPVVNVSPPA